MSMKKVLSQAALHSEVARWRASGCRIGFTCGAFDLLHGGHLDYLEKARELCDRLIVAINSDASVRSYKSPLRPISGERQRARLVAALACVDAVTVFDEPRPLALLHELKPDLYVKGGDYNRAGLRSAAFVESYGGICAVIPVTEDSSTTQLLERINSLPLHAPPLHTSTLLGRPIVFLDRDGTLIENIAFLNNPRRLKLLPGVGAGLKTLQDHGFTLVVVTNQQGLGLGYFDYDTFVAVNSELLAQLNKFSVRIARFYFCPHSLAENCECRKPGPALFRRALNDFQSRADDCFMIGDSPSDILSAQSAGCRALLVSAETTRENQPPGLSFQAAVEQVLQMCPQPS